MNEKRFFWSALGACFVVVVAGHSIAEWRGVLPPAPIRQAEAQVHPAQPEPRPIVYTPPPSVQQAQPTAYVVPTATWSGSDTMCKAYYTEIAQLRPLMGTSADTDRMIRGQMASAQAYIDLNCR